MSDSAWVQYQKECWRKRQQVRRQRDENLKKMLVEWGVAHFSGDDLAELRRCMYDPELIQSGFFSLYVINGRLNWVKKPQPLRLDQISETTQ